MSGHYILTVAITTDVDYPNPSALGPFVMKRSDDFESLADLAVALRDLYGDEHEIPYTPEGRAYWERQIREAWDGATHFAATLFRLIEGADRNNRDRLRKVFPSEVAAWEAFKRGELSP